MAGETIYGQYHTPNQERYLWAPHPGPAPSHDLALLFMTIPHWGAPVTSVPGWGAFVAGRVHTPFMCSGPNA
jgi:hypothetical protein